MGWWTVVDPSWTIPEQERRPPSSQRPGKALRPTMGNTARQLQCTTTTINLKIFAQFSRCPLSYVLFIRNFNSWQWYSGPPIIVKLYLLHISSGEWITWNISTWARKSCPESVVLGRVTSGHRIWFACSDAGNIIVKHTKPVHVFMNTTTTIMVETKGLAVGGHRRSRKKLYWSSYFTFCYERKWIMLSI